MAERDLRIAGLNDGDAWPPDWPPDWLDRLLREDAGRLAHIADDGFTARTLACLPPPRRPIGRWLVPAMTAGGSAIAVLCTPALGYVAQGIAQLFDLHHFSFSNLFALVPIAVFYAASFGAVREQ